MRLNSVLVFFLILLLSLSNSSNVSSSGDQENNKIVRDQSYEKLELTLLTPNTIQSRMSWSSLIENELINAGIHVKGNEFTGFDIIGARTFSYDVENSEFDTIPTYDEGGYDALFIGLSGDLDFDPGRSYSSSHLSPYGLNFAWFQNATVDELIQDYRFESNPTARNEIAKDIQALLYEEQPYIPIVNTQGLWSHDTSLGLTDKQLLLMSTSEMSMGWADISHPDTNSISYAHPYHITQFHPFLANENIAKSYLAPILPGLFERSAIDPTNWEPALAASMPTVSADGTIYTVDINPSAEFSNGNPVTATDVVNTYHMHMNQNIASVKQGDILPYIGNESQIVAIDSDTVEFTFDAPYFGALGIMSIGVMDDSVIGTPSSPAASDFNDQNGAYLVGAGPFKLSEFDSSTNYVELTAVGAWWGGDVLLDVISFTKHTAQSSTDGIQLPGGALGAVHIIDAQITYHSSVLENAAGVTLSNIADFGTQFLAVNMGHPVLGTGVDTPLGRQDPSQADDAARYIRKAISHLIPRQIIIDEIMEGRGTPAISLWPDVSFGYDDTLSPYEYNVELAIEYLEMAGYHFPENNLPSLLDFSYDPENPVQGENMTFNVEAQDDSEVSFVDLEVKIGNDTTFYTMSSIDTLHWHITISFDVGSLTEIEARVKIEDIFGNKFTSNWYTIELSEPTDNSPGDLRISFNTISVFITIPITVFILRHTRKRT